MRRTTIDFGIDLGTTNSTIAVLNGADVEVFKNNEDRECTPSAVWIDGKGRLFAGSRAKERYESEPENATIEFKLKMGTSHEYTFQSTGQSMKPEELSAEVLKSLRGDVQHRSGEIISAAVITVPAAFELPQCAATNRAAQLAGLTFSPLLQEPVAAALAYGFQSGSEKVFWLVYDFGGGTFDAAIIHVRDGVIQVVNHGGDNNLGGKLIDWEIVDQLLVPALKKNYSLSGFERSNPKWRSTFSKLKLHAEEAKIRLSRDQSVTIFIDPLCQDDRGNWVRFEFELDRNDLERITGPFVERSLNICKKVMAEKRLSPCDIEKVLLVGGPTLMPVFRKMLSERLQIPLEFRVDPLTVVARGAAIFAGTQRTEGVAVRPTSKGKYSLELEYKPIDTDPEPMVGGKVLGITDENLAGFTIEFVETKSQWRSGKISLMKNGAFMANLRAEKGRKNEYRIELKDSAGNIMEATPDMITYIIGTTITNPPLIHSLGVALANNEMQVFLGKGSPLPNHQRKVHRTTIDIKRGQSGAMLRIPVVEGENIKRADRNRLIGYLEVTGDKVKRDVPINSEVEITITIDESRLIKTEAYIPILDEEFTNVLELKKVIPNINDLSKDVEAERQRLEKARSKAFETGDSRAQELLQSIDRENMMHDVDSALNAAKGGDQDAEDRCQNRLLDLKNALDEVEDILMWPLLLEEAKEKISKTGELINTHGKSEDKRAFSALETEIKAAISARDKDLLNRKLGEMEGLGIRLLIERPEFWVGYLEYMVEQRPLMTDKSMADQLIAQGSRSIKNNDLEGLKSAVRQLIALLPIAEQERARGYGGTTMPF